MAYTFMLIDVMYILVTIQTHIIYLIKLHPEDVKT